MEVTQPIPDADPMKMSIPMTITEKIDMEWMKWYISYAVQMKMPDPMTPGNPMKEMSMNMKMMLNAGEKKVAFAMTGNMPGLPEQMANCTWMSVPWLQAPEALGTCVKAGFEKDGMSPPKNMPGLTITGPSCSAKDGMDVWSVNIKNETAKMEVEESWTMDKDSLFRGMTVSVKTDGTDTVTGALTTKDTPTQTGPMPDDLNYTKWGFDECKEFKMPGFGPPPGLMMEHLNRLIPQSLQGPARVVPLMMEVKDEGRRLQGGMPPGMPDIPAWVKCFMPAGLVPPGVVTV